MSLRDQLKEMVESVGGGMGAVIMGYDGIAIDEYIKPEATIDIQMMAVEYAAMLKEIKKTIEVLNSGAVEEISINTDRAQVLIRVIDEDFFVVMALQSEGNYGKGRYLLRVEAPELHAGLQ